MTGALWYLLRTTGWNRLRRQAMRLRNPRYAVAFVLGLIYFWFFLFRPGRGGRPDFDLVQSPLLAVLLPLLFVLAVAYTWIFGADRSALAFTPAEVALLFPAPVSRRALILYKLARAQLAICFTMLIWIILLPVGGSALPRPLIAITLWSLLTTYSLHRLGVALLRARVTEFGAWRAKGSIAGMLIFAAILAAIGAGLWGARAELAAAANGEVLFRSVAATLQVPPAGIALAPFNLLFAPLAAPDAGAWFSATWPVLLILGLHLWWVLGSDAAFEEAAAEASAKQAKRLAEFRARRTGTAAPKAKSARRTIPLAPTGPPAVAILWKNAVWLLRTGQVRGVLLPPGIALGALLVFGREGDVATLLIAGLSGMVAVMFLLFGPFVLRNDLRSDLLHLAFLKTLPLRARDVVLAQVVSTATAMATGQILLVLVAGAALLIAGKAAEVPTEVLVAAMIGVPALLLSLNFANFTIQNGAALLFPAWVRLGETTPGGVESMGQMMLVVVATVIALVLLLLLPAVLATIVVVILGDTLGPAIAAAALAAAALLAGEVYLLILGLAQAYERVEPIQAV